VNTYTTQDFDYHLPEELIAQNPLQNRDHSRLLVVKNNSCNLNLVDSQFDQLVNYLDADDLLIFNDSRVIKARLFGQKISGGKIELLIERVLVDNAITAHVRSNKTINIGLEVHLPDDLIIEVTDKLDGLFRLKIKSLVGNSFNWFDYLDKFGHLPLPPYMKREAVATDDTTYQTVYAKTLGSVAAPTAGLHFTQELLSKIESYGINIAHVTLHVGSGTFKPVSVTNLSEHKMHSEVYEVNEKIVELIRRTKARGNKVIAVGTTSLRVLESIALNGFNLLSGETDIFITPGFEFKVVDKLITNFHLPQSTLLMLVSAFAGFNPIKKVYQHAIENKYRFFSYGDAMLLERITT
jgi:S-adenosylmethionine:tRNA ribosyltransferase-isomerase